MNDRWEFLLKTLDRALTNLREAVETTVRDKEEVPEEFWKAIYARIDRCNGFILANRTPAITWWDDGAAPELELTKSIDGTAVRIRHDGKFDSYAFNLEYMKQMMEHYQRMPSSLFIGIDYAEPDSDRTVFRITTKGQS